MPLVFVHGVANRDSPDFRENRFERDEFFRALVLRPMGLDDARVTILNPYWGGEAVNFRWGNASVPDPRELLESFGADGDTEGIENAAQMLAAHSSGSTDILSIARASLRSAVDIIWSSSMQGDTSREGAAALADSYLRVSAYAQANPHPAWLDTAGEGNFTDQLLFHSAGWQANPGAAAGVEHESEEWESFGRGGLGDRIREGFRRVVFATGALGTDALFMAVRRRVHAGAALFVGDVFRYIQTREDGSGRPGKIVQIVTEALRAADAARHPRDDPQMILIGHSLGGVIAYDVLTYFDRAIEIDVFVTVGSQVALFEEMSLYKSSRAGVPPNPPADRLSRPPNVKRWLNVLDYNDLFAFRAEPVFAGVDDYLYQTGFGAMGAHSGYFRQASFYERLGEHLAAGGSRKSP
jgi:pimeloyl-ACP methyl ester carboxylesterase